VATNGKSLNKNASKKLQDDLIERPQGSRTTRLAYLAQVLEEGDKEAFLVGAQGTWFEAGAAAWVFLAQHVDIKASQGLYKILFQAR